jgi:hypothetical protein
VRRLGGLARLGADRGDAAPPPRDQVLDGLLGRSDVVDRDVVEVDVRDPFAEQHDRPLRRRRRQVARSEPERAQDHPVHQVGAHVVQRLEFTLAQSVGLFDQHGPGVLRRGGDDQARHLCEVRRLELGQRQRDQPRAAAAQVPGRQVRPVAELLDRPQDLLAGVRADVGVVVDHVRDGLDRHPCGCRDVSHRCCHGREHSRHPPLYNGVYIVVESRHGSDRRARQHPPVRAGGSR